MWLVIIGGVLVGILLFSLCKSAGDVDREMEKMFKEEIKLDRKEVI